ncbi:MAG TPA: alpha-isopropylmalate synthase regulatory domain-containing protein [Turneriella sp.]|nr:alpha-isopropylmalate synthase regulatory domain-containing protein [Turneriella sp.]
MKTRTVQIMDTTLRDGEQTYNVAFSASEKLQVARLLLEKANVNFVEVASARVSLGELESVKQITAWAKKTGGQKLLERIEILGFVDEKRSVAWMLEAGVLTLNMLTKGSLHHLQNQLRKTPKEHFDDIQKTIEYAIKEGRKVNVYLEDWSNGYLNSRAYMYEYLDFIATQPVGRIMLPDTLGVLYPKDVYAAISEITERYPKNRFDFHPHNDYGLGTANVLEAIRAGAHGVHTTVNCLGERTGNASLAEVVAGIHDHLGLKTTVNEKSLFNLSRTVETFSGKRLAANTPIVGEDVFTQTAGIHADGDKKGGLYESRLLPARFGRDRRYALGKLAGKASLDQNLKTLGITLDDAERAQVLKRIIELGDQKKQISVDDLPFIIGETLKRPEEKIVKIEQVTVTSGLHVRPMCSLTVSYKDKNTQVSGQGEGGYDAFMVALTSWAKANKIKMPRLIDYEVRIPPGGQTSALV